MGKTCGVSAAEAEEYFRRGEAREGHSDAGSYRPAIRSVHSGLPGAVNPTGAPPVQGEAYWVELDKVDEGP